MTIFQSAHQRFFSLGSRIRLLLAHVSLFSYVIGLSATVVVGGGYMAFSQSKSSAQSISTNTTTVQRRTLVSSVKAVGTVTFASEQQLRFNQKGTVAKVFKKEGDSVKKGDIIAQLDETSALSDIRQAQLALSASALQLKQLQADRTSQIQDAQNTVNESMRQLQQTQNDLAVTLTKLPSDLDAAKRSVQEKQAALDQAKSDLEKTKTSEMQSLALTAQSILSTSEQLLDSYYSVLTRNTDARPVKGDTEITINNLLYNDPSKMNDTQNAYFQAVNAVDAMHATYGASLAVVTDPQTLLHALNDANGLALDIYHLGESTYTMMLGASTDTHSFAVSDLTTLRSTVSTNRSKASDLISQIQTAQANLKAASSGDGIPSVTLQAKQDAVTSAQNALALAQENLTLLTTKNPADLAAQKDALAKMQEDLKSKQAGYNSTTTSVDVSISLKQNDVAQKAAALQKVQKTLQDYELIAPFDGILRHIDYQVGDNLLDTGETKYATLENPDFLIVTIPLDQVDVVRVHTGMPATINFDAVAGQTFDGVIDEINPTPIQQSGVVSYDVLVKMPTPKDLTLLSGMTATVQIQISQKANVLTVPNLALRRQGSRTVVQKADGTNVPVQTGMTNGQYTEILSGLHEGDSIMSINIVISQSSSSANPNAAQQLLRGAGGFGGGRPRGG